MPSKNVLFLVPTEQLGGAESVLRSLARSCAADGSQVWVVVLAGAVTGYWDDLGPNVVLVRTGATRELTGLCRAILHIRGISSMHEIDLAISSHTHCNALLGALRRLGILRTRCLVARESTVIGLRFTGLKRFLFRLLYPIGYPGVDRVVCQTQFMRDALFTFVPGIVRKDVVVARNPLDLDRVVRAAGEDAVLPDGPFVLAVGRLIPEKGYDLLITAFAELCAGTPLHLVILGEGPQRAGLQRLIDRLGLVERIHMPGRLDNPYPWMRAARLCVVSSRVEGFPNTLLEMMALCRQVVGTRCAGEMTDIPGVHLCAADDLAALEAALAAGLAAASDDRRNRQAFLRTLEPAQYLRQLTA